MFNGIKNFAEKESGQKSSVVLKDSFPINANILSVVAAMAGITIDSVGQILPKGHVGLDNVFLLIKKG